MAKAIQIWIDEKLQKAFKIKAIQDGETMTSLLTKWINQYIKGNK